MYKMFTYFNLHIFNISYVREVLASVTTCVGGVIIASRTRKSSVGISSSRFQ